jgi:hypothetical protein
MLTNVCFVPKTDIHVYSSPIASNKSAGTFAGILKIEKNQISLRQGLQATIRFPPPMIQSIICVLFERIDIS